MAIWTAGKRVKLRNAPFAQLSCLLQPLTCGFSASGLPRLVSWGLCADPYLMAFAKNQIAALTHLSRDPDLSAHAEAAQAFPVSDGQIESLIELQPDIVIVSSWSDPMRNALIERLGFQPWLWMQPKFRWAREDIMRLGVAIGRSEAHALICKTRWCQDGD